MNAPSRSNPVTLDELLASAPEALAELTAELFRRADIAMRADKESQLTACLQLGLRAASIAHGMARVIDLHTLDSFETLNRAAIEARDLLMHFRFDDKGTREKIGYWFAGAKDSAWKPDHTKIDEFLTKQGAVGIQLASNWSKLSVLTHPTKYAADNSTVVIVNRVTGLLNGLNIVHKRADYIVGISRLITAATYNFPGWISLGLDFSTMPSADSFSQNAEDIAVPIVNGPLENPLPAYSIRPPKKKH